MTDPFFIILVILVTLLAGIIIIKLMEDKNKKPILLIILISGNLLLGGWVLGLTLPISVQYQREYGAHINMAYTQATFEAVKYEVTIVWENMNKSFAGCDYLYTYNSPFYWDQNYENSLAAQNNYLRSLMSRIDSYIEQYTKLKESTSASMLQDWYDESINNLREEMKQEGGLDWVIKDAWLLKFYPIIYYLNVVVLVFYVLLVSIWWIILLKEDDA